MKSTITCSCTRTEPAIALCARARPAAAIPASHSRRVSLFALVVANHIPVLLDTGSTTDASRLHLEPADDIAFDGVVARGRRALGASSEIDAAAQHVGLAGGIVAAEACRLLVAVREIEVDQAIVRDDVPGTDHEDTAE